MIFRFASPWFLALLALIPLALWHRRRGGMRPPMTLPGLGEARRMPPSPALVLRHGVTALKYIALALMIIGLARPQWGSRRELVNTEGINIALAVDLSESMAALDFRRQGRVVNRLEAVKGVVREFVADRSGDRIGMVVFGSEAYTQIPLTRDYNTLVAALDRLEIGAAGKSTAIGDAIGIAIKRLADIPSDSNVIILLTDGRSNSGLFAPATAAAIAAEEGVRIHAIGVGGRGKAPFLIRDPIFGERKIYQEVDIDEDALREVAEKTGGRYFRAENTEALAEIYETIDAMEKTEIEVTHHAELKDLYPVLLVPALGLLALWIVLANTRFLRVP